MAAIPWDGNIFGAYIDPKYASCVQTDDGSNTCLCFDATSAVPVNGYCYIYGSSRLSYTFSLFAQQAKIQCTGSVLKVFIQLNNCCGLMHIQSCSERYQHLRSDKLECLQHTTALFHCTAVTHLPSRLLCLKCMLLAECCVCVAMWLCSFAIGSLSFDPTCFLIIPLSS